MKHHFITEEGNIGAGKTTLLRTLSGLNKATEGSATWDELNILHSKPERLVRHGISHVCEGKSVIPELTVAEKRKKDKDFGKMIKDFKKARKSNKY